MSFSIASNYTQRTYSWTDWKSICLSKLLVYQFDESNESYAIWGYDGPEVHICQIWKTEVPQSILDTSEITQEQNDIDKNDFETNFKSLGNKPIELKTATRVNSIAPAKGLGGFVPDASNDPYQPNSDEVVSLYVDGEGSLITRGQTLTDEGSLRDDFIGDSLETVLTGELTFTNGSQEVTGIGTLFDLEIDRNCYVKLSADGYDKYVAVIRAPNDTSMLLEEPYNGSSATGEAVKARWLKLPVGSNPGNIIVEESCLRLVSGEYAENSIYLYRDGDYPPLLSSWNISVSQRINNQYSFIGLRDDIQEPNMYCDILFEGTDNTKIKFRSAWNKDEQLSTVSLPSGLNTSEFLRYKIDVSTDYCALLINGVMVVKHDNHIPDPYISLYVCAGIKNLDNVSETSLSIDNVFFSNQDQVQIASTFIAPISVITKEDQHSIFGTLTTESTDADQNIISYTVPDGKVFYLIGYRIDGSTTSASNPAKIGKNDLSTEPLAPGEVDGNIFRSFFIDVGKTTGEIDYGGNPRKLGVGGDVIKVSVTPLSALSSIWHAALDYVLR